MLWTMLSFEADKMTGYEILYEAIRLSSGLRSAGTWGLLSHSERVRKENNMIIEYNFYIRQEAQSLNFI